ncbi:MAG: cytidine deaminase [Verrucomicrobiales bacterium]
MTDRELMAMAAGAARQAYAPYSEFRVGAALLGKSGKVFVGCNVENASYGLTMCAERVALGQAVTGGEREFVAVAISLKNGGSPCGACRQVLYEFSPAMRVLMADEAGDLVKEAVLADLLPEGFGPASL